jgi:peptidoglycan/LPS O-acetylase OafA/YrhL
MLRGVLAVYVVFGHCRWLLWTGHSQWMAQPHAAWLEPIVYAGASLRYGREAVMCFFVLSGFFIHMKTAQILNTRHDAFSSRAFFLRRAHRLCAPYAFALLATMVCDAIGRQWFAPLYDAATGDRMIDALFADTGYGWRSVVAAVVMLPTSLGTDFGSNVALWSLGYEVVYYAIFPVWLAIRRKSAVLAFVVVPGLCLSLTQLSSQPFIVTALIYYPVWLAGAGLVELVPRLKSIRITSATAIAVFALGFALHALGRSAIAAVLSSALFGGAAVVAFASFPERIAAFRAGRLFEFLGERSYTLYIVHVPFVTLLSAATFRLLGGRPSSGWVAAAGAAATVAFGCLCFELCEKHFVHHRAPATAPIG